MYTHNGLVDTLVQTHPDPQAIGLVPMVVEQYLLTPAQGTRGLSGGAGQ